MSIDRLLATVYLIRMRIYRTRRNAFYACLLVWIFALLTSSPYGFYARVSRLPEQHLIGTGQGLCEVAFPSDDPNASQMILNGDYLGNVSLSDYFSNFNLNLTSSSYYGDFLSNLTESSGFLSDDDDYVNASDDDEPYSESVKFFCSEKYWF